MKSYDENHLLISVTENGKKTYKFRNSATSEYEDTGISYLKKSGTKKKKNREQIGSGMQGTLFMRETYEQKVLVKKLLTNDKYRPYSLSISDSNRLHMELLKREELIFGKPITYFLHTAIRKNETTSLQLETRGFTFIRVINELNFNRLNNFEDVRNWLNLDEKISIEELFQILIKGCWGLKSAIDILNDHYGVLHSDGKSDNIRWDIDTQNLTLIDWDNCEYIDKVSADSKDYDKENINSIFIQLVTILWEISKEKKLETKLVDIIQELAIEQESLPSDFPLSSSTGINSELIIDSEDNQDTNSKLAELKSSFLDAYDAKLASDRRTWCGFYGFFATSNLARDMSLKELIQHAQGHSGKGSGKRSQGVMKEMGWLDDDNQVTSEIEQLCP